MATWAGGVAVTLEDAILRVQYVPSALNLSDYFSRMPKKGEWSLEAELAQDLMHGTLRRL